MATVLGPSFRVSGIEPPGVKSASIAERKAFWTAALAFTLAAKQRELAAGLDRYGKPMAALAPSTVLNRRSAMGPADPSAPALQPAHERSRTLALLTGKATPSGVVCWWKYDEHTKSSWGTILRYHREGRGKLPKRDVIGLSPASRAEVARQSADWWAQYVAGLVDVPKFTPVVKEGDEKFLIEKSPKPKSPKVKELVLNGKHYTLQSGSIKQIKEGIANGTFSGFAGAAEIKADLARSGIVKLGDGKYDFSAAFKKKPPPPPATPAPKPKKPKPAPFQYFPTAPLADRVAFPKTPPEPIGRHLPSDAELAKPKKKPAKPKKPKAPQVEAAPTPPATPPPPAWPKSLEGLEDVRALGGSTGAKLVRDPATGRLFVLKAGASQPHVLNEFLADQMYRSAGIDVPESKLIVGPGGRIHKLSEYIEGKTLGHLKTADPAAFEAAAEKLREGFAVDALLANWDVIGASMDNVLVDAAGRVYRIDNGGALSFRAQGGKKSADQWTASAVGELETMRKGYHNPSAVAIFGKLTDDQVKAQALALAEKRNGILTFAGQDAQVMKGRFDAIARKFAPRPPAEYPRGWTPSPAERFRRIDSDEELQKWVRKNYAGLKGELTADQVAAVRDYTGAGYSALNAWLRGQRPEPSNGKIVPDLDAALKVRPLANGLTVYRGITNPKQVFEDLGVANADEIAPGMKIVDAGYTSSSPLSEKGWSGLKLEIRVPEGSSGAWVAAMSRYASEKEYLIGREWDTLIVVDKTSTHIVCELARSVDLAELGGTEGTP